MAKKFSTYYGKKKVDCVLLAGPDGKRSGKALVDWERWCQDICREIQMLNKRREIFQSAIEGKLRVQDRVSERMQDQIIEEIKEMEQRKTEEALQLVRKEHDLWMYQRRKQKQKGCRKSGN